MRLSPALVVTLALSFLHAVPSQATLIQEGARTIDARASVYDVPGAAMHFSGADAQPWTIGFESRANLYFTFPSVTGLTNSTGGAPILGPDGGVAFSDGNAGNPDGRAITGGANGLSGAWFSGAPGRQMALVGVFHDEPLSGARGLTPVYDSFGAYDFRRAAPSLNQVFYIGDGSVRRVNDGASFRFGDGSVRVIGDGTSNTILLGEGNTRFNGNNQIGWTATFGDGSVRFLRDAAGAWSYQRDGGPLTPVGSDQRFVGGDGSVRFLADGTSNTLLFGESSTRVTGNDRDGWSARYADGSARFLGSTQSFLAGDGSVRFVSNGSSFRFGDGSVRMIADGTSNTLLLGEGNARYSGNNQIGWTATFGDGSVRFVRDAAGLWHYQRNGGPLTPLGGDERFVFGDGSVRFLADGTSNTLLFGESSTRIVGNDRDGWSALSADGSVRLLGTGEAPLFGDGSVRFITDGTSNTVVFGEGMTAPAGYGPAFYFGDGSVRQVPGSGPFAPWSSITDDTGLASILDGLSNTLLLQEFAVPAGATRLTLGFIDSAGYTDLTGPGDYGDNTGFLQVNYALQAAAVPEPGSLVLLALGLVGLAGRLRARR